VFRIPLTLPFDDLATVNAYVLETAKGPVIVDGGLDTPASRESMRGGLATLGYDLADVHLFLVTHAHADRYGLASASVGRPGWQCTWARPSAHRWS
jgi:glyoxylase-like metal-dependent hydrolase (beta-lactamase superfamily II)